MRRFLQIILIKCRLSLSTISISVACQGSFFCWKVSSISSRYHQGTNKSPLSFTFTTHNMCLGNSYYFCQFFLQSCRPVIGSKMSSFWSESFFFDLSCVPRKLFSLESFFNFLSLSPRDEQIVIVVYFYCI